MFSGIIEELGEVYSIKRRGLGAVLEVKATVILEDISIGDSIAINGVCLTVTKVSKGLAAFDIMPETLRVSNLNFLRVASKVNLERSLKVGERISGHFVTGHVDCIGLIRSKSQVKGNLCFQIVVPSEFMKFIYLKGSVAIDGISLTVMNKKSNLLSVYIIPHTLTNTTLGFKGSSDKVNVEFDILAKQAAK